MYKLNKQTCVLILPLLMLASGDSQAVGAGVASKEFKSLNVLEYRKHQEGNLPKFEQYPARASFSGKPARVVLDTPGKRMFRTRLRDAATIPVNFSGEHVLTFWGCGTNCIMGAAINLKSGHVVELPGTVSDWLGEGEEGEKLEYRKDSRLLIARGFINEGETYGHFYYEFTGREFKLIRMLPVDRTAHSDRMGIKMRRELEKTAYNIEREKQLEVMLNDDRPRGWMGIEAQELPVELAAKPGAKRVPGVLIAGVVKKGPADTAGIQPGDVLTHINGTPVLQANDLLLSIASLKPGSVAKVRVLRRGESGIYAVTLVQRPKTAE